MSHVTRAGNSSMSSGRSVRRQVDVADVFGDLGVGRIAVAENDGAVLHAHRFNSVALLTQVQIVHAGEFFWFEDHHVHKMPLRMWGKFEAALCASRPFLLRQFHTSSRYGLMGHSVDDATIDVTGWHHAMRDRKSEAASDNRSDGKSEQS